MTFFSQSYQLMSVQLLVASSSSSNASFLLFKHVFRQEYVYDCTFLRLEPPRLCRLCPLSSFFRHATIRAFKQNAVSWRIHIALDAGQVTYYLLLPRSVDKNHVMRQQAYHCVISASCRHQCTVNTSTKLFGHTVCWLNLLRTWEFPVLWHHT